MSWFCERAALLGETLRVHPQGLLERRADVRIPCATMPTVRIPIAPSVQIVEGFDMVRPGRLARAILRAAGYAPGAAAVAVSVAALGCGSSTAPNAPSQTASVRFVYRAATTTDPAILARFPGCVQAVGATHIHPSWRGYARELLERAAADRWEAAFDDVPVGSEQRVRISDPNACDTDPNGASVENVFANGMLLTRVVDTPGNGIEPGLAFSVSADGRVSP